ncbi:hypothetical protein IU459_16970 [Nocardia amamiensis]|uniref:Transposase n=1 Tax=Nocardia amamiensis TaxID=404578 RepID=A0ABS0CRH2_9NOCA|nr:hypothetical protein [Nocardia amamiensis]MBF6299221.1 hypothetical protein [Nocardia amamiensis]
MNHGLVEATSARISSTIDRKGSATMPDKTSAHAVIETAVRLLGTKGDGATSAIAAAHPAHSFPSASRRELKGTKPIRPATAYRAKPQRPLWIPGRG